MIRVLLYALLFAGASSQLSIAEDIASDAVSLLSKHCVACHGPDKQQGGLRLDNSSDARAVADSGEQTIVAGKPDQSSLIARVLSSDEFERMPQRGEPLTPSEVELLRKWIEQGAKWIEVDPTLAPASSGKQELKVTDRDREHWAYQPLGPRLPPTIASSTIDQDRNLIDVWIESMVSPDAAKLQRLPDASLLRRLAYSIKGLPPSLNDVESTLDRGTRFDASKFVDEGLASKEHAEHLATMWLDVVRYADSDGYESDADRPHTWRYRDWVITAIQQNMPLDKFLKWQLAGDELAPADLDALIATGFLTLGPHAETQPTDLIENKEQVRYDNLDDIVSTFGSAFLGLTVGCARCHDHKYDAIPTRDYYRISASFAGVERRTLPLDENDRQRKLLIDKTRVRYQEERMEQLQIPESDRVLLRVQLNHNNLTQVAAWNQWSKQIKITDDELPSAMTDDDRATYEKLLSLIADAGATKHQGESMLIVHESSRTPADSWLLQRGSPMKKIDAAPFGVLQVASRSEEASSLFLIKANEQAADKVASSRQRAALALWLTDSQEGAGTLVSRVFVNRLWQHYFGQGLVKTPNDFGVQVDRPAALELSILDALARTLIESDWDIRVIERQLLTSNLFASTIDPSNSADGQLLTLVPRPLRRLSSNSLRDALLQVSGKLQPCDGGPGFRASIPASAVLTRSKHPYPADVADDAKQWKRSVYMFVKRSVRFPFGELFDTPDSNTSCGRRSESIAPTQQLTLLNDPFVRLRATDFADRLSASATDPNDQVKTGYRLALGRDPSSTELKEAVEFVNDSGSLVDWCHAVFLMSEFIYVD